MTKLFSHPQLEYLTEIYLYANTPRYLYRHYKNSQIIQGITTRNSEERLIEEFRDTTQEMPMSLESTVIAYAIMMSISFLPYGKALRIYSSLDYDLLDWGHEITSIFEKTSIDTSTSHHRDRARVSQTEIFNSTSTLKDFKVISE